MKFSNSKSLLSLLICLIVISLLFVLPASAHNSQPSYGASGTIYAGVVQAGSSSSTVGGSSFEVNVNSNGKASGFANSAGGGAAAAGGTVTKNGVSTYTDNTSYSSGDAKSHVAGSGTGTGSAAQGTDTNSAAAGQFGKFGGGFGVSAGFTH